MFIVLFVLWIILNGRITLEIAIFGAVICGALYLFLYKFMEYSPKRELVIVRCTGKILKYVVFLVVEVIKAALAVSKLVLEFDREPEPVLVRFKTGIRTQTGQTVLANSITQTWRRGTTSCTAWTGNTRWGSTNRALWKSLWSWRLRQREEEKVMFHDIPVLGALSEKFLIVVLAVLCVMFLLCLLRLVLGPSVADRLLAVNMLGGIVTAAIALLGLLLEESYLLDISLIYGLISFLGVVILSQIYIGACRARNEKRKKREEGALDDGS